MLGRGFILLALSVSPLIAGAPSPAPIPAPVPGNVDYLPSSPQPMARSLDFGVNLNLLGLNISLGGSRMIDLDRARAQNKIQMFANSEGEGKRSTTGDVSVTNVGVLYTVSVGVGTPPTQYNLVIDTGSSNTWVGAGQNYTKTSSSVNTGKNVSVGYGSGGFDGVEFLDTLTLSDALVVNNQSIGVANTSHGFTGYDGILGLAPVGLTTNTVQDTPNVPTVPDNLASQGTIPSEIVGISFAPTTTEPNSNGVMTFGGPGEGQYTGDISYVGVTSKSPATKFWGIDMSSTYGSSNASILSSGSGIVDTGTTLVLLASDAYQAYVAATGATLDSKVGLLSINSTAYSSLQSLFFTVGSTTFEFTPNAQTFPRALNSFVNGDANATYLVVGDLGQNSGSGLDFILGYSFLERFYSVYDSANKQVGLATTSNTYSTSN